MMTLKKDVPTNKPEYAFVRLPAKPPFIVARQHYESLISDKTWGDALQIAKQGPHFFKVTDVLDLNIGEFVFQKSFDSDYVFCVAAYVDTSD